MIIELYLSIVVCCAMAHGMTSRLKARWNKESEFKKKEDDYKNYQRKSRRLG